MKVLFGIQARSASSRLPGKIYAEIGQKSVIEWVFRAAEYAAETVRLAHTADLVVLGPSNDAKLKEYCGDKHWTFFPGDPGDLVTRYVQCAEHFESDIIVRLTADCWNANPVVICRVVEPVLNGQVDYASNCIWRTWIEGKDAQCCNRKALEWFDKNQKIEREHPFYPFDTNLLIRNQFENNGLRYKMVLRKGSAISQHMSIDTLEDLEYAKRHHDETLYELLDDPIQAGHGPGIDRNKQ